MEAKIGEKSRNAWLACPFNGTGACVMLAVIPALIDKVKVKFEG